MAAERDFYSVLRATSSYLGDLLSTHAANYQGEYSLHTYCVLAEYFILYGGPALHPRRQLPGGVPAGY